MLNASIQSSWKLLQIQHSFCHQINTLNMENQRLRQEMQSHQRQFDQRYAAQCKKLEEAKQESEEERKLIELRDLSLRCEIQRLVMKPTVDRQENLEKERLILRYRDDLVNLQIESQNQQEQYNRDTCQLREEMKSIQREHENRIEQSSLELALLQANNESIKENNEKQLTNHEKNSGGKLGPLGGFFVRAAVAVATAIPTTLAGLGVAGPGGAVVGGIAGLIMGAGTQFLAAIGGTQKPK